MNSQGRTTRITPANNNASTTTAPARNNALTTTTTFTGDARSLAKDIAEVQEKVKVRKMLSQPVLDSMFMWICPCCLE